MAKRFLTFILLLSVLGAGCSNTSNTDEEYFGTSESGAQWVNYVSFNGFQTKFDPEKIADGANANGQNTSANNGDRISIRGQGFDLYPSTAEYSSTTSPIITMHTMRKRSGEHILMRAASTTLEWYDETGVAWEVLKDGYSSPDFGFADNNINTDQTSYTYFGNSVEPFSRWTGVHTNFTQAPTNTATVLFVVDTTDFPSAGTIVYCGTEIAYSSKTATTFTVASAHECTNGRGVAQAVQEFTGATYPRGNIYLFADNRLFISGVVSSTQVIYFSGYGTSTDFGSLDSLVSSSTYASAGLFNLAEGGGAVTAMTMDEGSLYFFKRSIIYKATLSDSIYTLQPLKTFDQKSQTIGAINKRSTFVSSNGTFFITPDNQIMLLERVEQVDYPQSTPISDIIKPTIDNVDFTSSTGIVFRDKAYFAAKSSSDLPFNNTVFVYNLQEQLWESPIVGWNVGDWAIYQEDVLEQLYFGDSIIYNTYEVINSPQDYIYDTQASWRSKQYTFGLPHALKYIENVYVEGYIAQNTELGISLLLDEDGFTQRFSTTLNGTDSQYIYNSTIYNAFGLTPFGTYRFGSNADQSGKKKFRIYLGKDFRQIPFYNAQIEFGSDGQNQQWEITGYGFLVRQAPVPEKRELFKAFK